MRKPEPMQFVTHSNRHACMTWNFNGLKLFVYIRELTGQHTVAVVETTMNEWPHEGFSRILLEGSLDEPQMSNVDV